MLASLDGMPNGPQHQFLLRQIADLYAETDPNKGFEWLNSLPPTMESVAAFPSFFAKLGNLDPTRAITWVEQIKFEGGQKAAASAATTIIAFHNPAQGWELLDKWKSMLPDQVTMQARLIQSISQGSGAEVAWNIYNPENQILAPEDTTRFFKAVRFATAKEALDFAVSKVTPNNQPGAMEAIVRNWSPTGLESVSKELAARPVEPKYDGAYAALAGRIPTTDPVSAAKWSNIISDQKLKDTVQRQIRDFARINDKAIFKQVDEAVDRGEQAAPSDGEKPSN